MAVVGAPGRTVPRSDGTASDGGPTLSLESDAGREWDEAVDAEEGDL